MIKNVENWGGMRVLTVREPWATLLVTGVKDVENRSRYYGHRGPLLIHASASLTRAYYDAACQWILLHVPAHLRPAELPTFAECKESCGKIIGGCELIDCRRDNYSPWCDGEGWGLNMTGAWVAVTPVPFKGQLSLGTYHAPKGGGGCLMILDPKLLALPDFTVEETQRCIDVSEPGMFETGLIVDANNTIYRLAFAASKDCADATDMLAVFVDRIKAVVKDINADVVVCCIDSGVSLRRSMLGATKKPDKTPEQEAVVAMAREALHLLQAAGWGRHPWLNPRWQPGYEADDLCAAWAVSGHFVHSVIYSTDSDLYQVTNGSGIVQLSPATGAFVKSDVPPALVPGVKALMGDTSDNVVGIKGVGPVTALKIVTGEKTLELDKATERRVRGNVALTALPFPGSHLILDGAPLVEVPMFAEEGQGEELADENIPF